MKQSAARFEGNIQGIFVDVVKNSATQEQAHAFLFPQFNNQINTNGMATYVLSDRGGDYAVRTFLSYIRLNDMDMGKALLTGFDGPIKRIPQRRNQENVEKTPSLDALPNPLFAIHVTTARSVPLHDPARINREDISRYRDEQWSDVHNAVKDALRKIIKHNADPEKQKITVLNIPLIGCGVTGTLTPTQSSEAIMKAIHLMADELKTAGIHRINIAVHSPALPHKVQPAYDAAVETLQSRSYETAIPTRGTAEFNMEDYHLAHRKEEFIKQAAGQQAFENRSKDSFFSRVKSGQKNGLHKGRGLGGRGRPARGEQDDGPAIPPILPN